MVKTWLTLTLLLGFASDVPAADRATVRVAALQCYAEMGRTAANTSNLVVLIRRAAKDGAKIVVTPECAVQGYMHPPSWTSWTTATNGARYVGNVAEPVPGPSIAIFSALAKELDVYLGIGLVERDGNKFFNAQVLIAPDGGIVAHHRKKALWTPGDSAWCSQGDLPIQVVDTRYGRVGLMICYDFHVVPPQLAKQRADIVLYSVGWYGPNEKQWFETQFPQQAVIPFGFSVVSANWAGRTETDVWPGRGHSCIITGDGKVLAMAKTVIGNEIVMADLPVKRGLAEPPAK
jgi:predicted amidohydrolase